MTDDERTQIERWLDDVEGRVNQASPSPWQSYNTDAGNWMVDLGDDREAWQRFLWVGDVEMLTDRDIHNADFIAAAREDLPQLVALCRRLLAEDGEQGR
jgi:hypothetical protein